MQDLQGRLHQAIEDRSLLDIAVRNLLSGTDRPHLHAELHEGPSPDRCPYCLSREAAKQALQAIGRSAPVVGRTILVPAPGSEEWDRRRGALRAGIDRLRAAGLPAEAEELVQALVEMEPPLSDELAGLLREWEVGRDG